MESNDNGRAEPVVECPYCGIDIFREALYGHVFSADDTQHGDRGTVPDDYSDRTPAVVEYVEVQPTQETSPGVDRVLCRYCYQSFTDHGLKVHIGMKKGDEQHPKDATVEKARLPLSIYGEIEPGETEPPDESPSNGQDATLSDYRSRLKSMTRPPGEGPNAGAESVPIDALLELLNDYRERGSESSAYVNAARMLQDVLEEHGALNP